MSVFVVVALVFAIIVSLLLARRSGRARREISPVDVVRRPRAKSSRRVGKMLRTDASCCDAARQTAELWFKEWDAPSLPLVNCDRRETCRCAWERNYDRRIVQRRVGTERRGAVRFGTAPDRRVVGERRTERKDDWKDGDVDL